MIHGLLQAYDDPYTVFIEPAEAKLQNDELRGHFGGIGVRMERDQENHLLLFPYPDSPAKQAGILEGDRLARVDDLEVKANTPPDTIEAALRGPVGQGARLTSSAPRITQPRRLSSNAPMWRCHRPPGTWPRRI